VEFPRSGLLVGRYDLRNSFPSLGAFEVLNFRQFVGLALQAFTASIYYFLKKRRKATASFCVLKMTKVESSPVGPLGPLPWLVDLTMH
jgi:hypothetical protein